MAGHEGIIDGAAWRERDNFMTTRYILSSPRVGFTASFVLFFRTRRLISFSGLGVQHNRVSSKLECLCKCSGRISTKIVFHK